MWTRDSAVQMASYLPRVAKRPAIRYYIEGAIRAQAYFILQDPWANAYNPSYIAPSTMGKNDRMLGRGGWVWTRNFELDSIAYFYNFLWNFHQTPSIHKPSTLLSEPQIYDAVVTLLRLLETEQYHEEKSPYRYSELPREGLGPPCGYTGMVWSAFRPSDDQQVYSYNIPDNAYLMGSLLRLIKLNEAVWLDHYIQTTAKKLVEEIHQGILKFGIIEVEPGVKMYAYEVDGLGKYLADFDDPNLPSLLALPLLGYESYDKQIYENTRNRILSTKNKFYFFGSKLKGMGSPHTPGNYIWPLATAVEALTTDRLETKAESLKMLIQMAEGPFGLPHESVEVSNTQATTRNEFGWASAMVVVAVEQLLPGIDCDAEAEAFRLREIETREAQQVGNPVNKGKDRAWYYEQLEADVIHTK